MTVAYHNKVFLFWVGGGALTRTIACLLLPLALEFSVDHLHGAD